MARKRFRRRRGMVGKARRQMKKRRNRGRTLTMTRGGIRL